MMQPRSGSNIPTHRGVIDCATLYLCRQGPRWVVDTYDAQFDLLNSAHRACPDAVIMSTDGALTSADYEWRVEVRGIQARPGDLGVALHRELSAEPTRVESAPPRLFGRRCHWGLSPSFSGRPRNF
jgi:hypothetical protein